MTGDTRRAALTVVMLAVILASVQAATSVPVHVSPVPGTEAEKGLTQQDIDAAWRFFLRRYQPSYQGSVRERAMRKRVFAENLYRVKEQDASLRVLLTGETVSQGLGITKFSDMTPEEFHQRHLINCPYSPIPEDAPRPRPSPEQVAAAPDAFDWREKGAVTRVRNQGSCGSCWAFSVAEVVEGANAVAGNPLLELSPMELTLCASTECGCHGGWPYRAIKEWVIPHGMVPEAAMPYCVPPLGNCYARVTNTTYCMTDKHLYYNRTCEWDQHKADVAVHVSAYQHLSKNEDELAAQLVQHGPLSVLLDADWMQHYSHGIYDGWWCDQESPDHAVLMVGYGHDGSKPYWILKNSWDTNWGEHGYARIIRGKNKCGIANNALSVTLA